MYSIKDIDVSRLRRDYSKYPLIGDEYITKEEFGYLYLEVNLSFEEIDIYLQSKPGTALNKNRRKPNAKISNKFGFKKSSTLIAAKMRNATFEKYGVTTPFALDEVKEKVVLLNKERMQDKEKREQVVKKIKETTLKRFGVDNAMKCRKVYEKGVQKRVELYGTCNNNEKIKKTKLERYDDSGYLNKEKAKETLKNRFGVESPFESVEIKNKAVETVKKKYGVDNVFKLKEFQKKAKDVMRERYGVDKFSLTGVQHRENYNKDFVEKNFIEDGYFKIEEALSYFNVNRSSMDAFKRRNDIVVPNKHEKHQMQNQIYEFIKSIYAGDVICDTRKVISPLELDIYLPDLKLAIEFDGLMFHSVSTVEDDRSLRGEIMMKDYHKIKTDMCEELGIKLFHIFENEWLDLNKQAIWKSVIRNAIIQDNFIYARNCIVKSVDKTLKKKFLEENHLQGDCVSEINLGLFYKDGLVSLMTFGKPRFSKKYNYELLRFCTKKDLQVRFAASKLLSCFKKMMNKSTVLVSYANRRWSNGHLYELLGFEKQKTKVEPSYFYFRNNEKLLYSRIKFQKGKLKDILETFDESLSESENMFNNGFRKIYDSGSLTYCLKL